MTRMSWHGALPSLNVATFGGRELTMLNKKKLVPLWLMYILGALFVVACGVGAAYFNAPGWMRWLILAISLYPALKLFGLARRQQS